MIKRLPGCEFELCLPGEVIKGKFSVYALRSFSLRHGCRSFPELLDLFNSNLSDSVKTIGLLTDVLQCAVNYLSPDKQYNRAEAYTWLEFIGYSEGVELLQYGFNGDLEGRPVRTKRKRKNKWTWQDMERVACEAGVSPQEFHDCSLPQLDSILGGYNARVTKSLEQTRTLAYMVYLSVPRERASDVASIYEFMPLHTDPSPAQIERMKRSQERKDRKKFERDAMRMIEEAGKLGAL